MPQQPHSFTIKIERRGSLRENYFTLAPPLTNAELLAILIGSGCKGKVQWQ